MQSFRFHIRAFVLSHSTLLCFDHLKLLRKDGWFLYEQNGSHIQLKHPVKKGRVTVPNHKGDLKKGTLHSILKQAGLE
jgi:predicted RNA binding protein YcfA (HicA-like mRNA interferase family)